MPNQLLSTIGLDKEKSVKLGEQLNALLSDFQIYYQNLRGFHWNVKGSNFFELHAKFEELYRDAQEKIDELAELILTLGQTPLNTFEDYLQNSEVKVYKNLSNDREIVQALVDMLQVLLIKEREVIEVAGKADDEGTADLIIPLIAEQEKTVWMLRAWLNQNLEMRKFENSGMSGMDYSLME